MEIIRARRKIVVLRRSAFTLVELLVVIGIIAVLFAVVLIAINPAKRFSEANNARRQSDVRSMSDTIAQYITDKRGQTPNYIPETPTCIGNGETLNGNGGREVDPARDSTGLVRLWHFNANEGKELSDSDLEIYNNAVSLWHFNEGIGQTVSDSKGANIGTFGAVDKDPAWTNNGRFSNALNFDGNDYVGFGDPDSVDFGSGDFTLEAWVRLTITNQSGQETIIGKDEGASSSEKQFFLVADADDSDAHKIRIGYYKADGLLVSATTDSSMITSTANWHHIVGVRRGDDLLIYVDGDPQSVMSNGGAPGAMKATAAELRVGIRALASGNYFNGRIDEVAIYNTALDATVIKEHYDRRTVHDSSVNASNSTMSGPVSLAGRFGEALRFDGLSDYVDIGNIFSPPQTEPTELSVELWAYVNSFNQPSGVDKSTPFISDWNIWNGTNQKGYMLRAYHSSATNTTRWQFVINNDSSYIASNNAVSAAALTDIEFSSQYAGKWLHLSGVFKGGNYMKLYINGQEAASKTSNVPVKMTSDTTNQDWIARTGVNSGYLNGIIDEAAVWSRALDPQEIVSHSISCYDLSSYLVPEYLGSIPKDPKTGADADTGYTISKNTSGAITIQAITPEAIDNQTPEIKASR